MIRQGLYPTLLTNGAGEFMGIYLGSDACVEHSIRNEPMLRAFGVAGPDVETGMLGLSAIQNTLAPESLLFFTKFKAEGEARAVLYGGPKHELPVKGRFPKHWEDELEFRTDAQVATAWDQTNFAIHVREGMIDPLKELLRAFQALRVGFSWFCPAPGVPRDGLSLLLLDRVDAEAVAFLEVRHRREYAQSVKGDE